MKTIAFHLFLFLFLMPGGIQAQKKSAKITLTGKVLDLEEKPISDAMIIIDDKKTECVTDSAGNFTLEVNPAAVKIGVLTFGNGYFEDSISGRKHIEVNFASVAKYQHLKQEYNTGSQEASLSGRNVDPELAVNLGYAHVKVKNLTGNVGVIDARNDKFTQKYARLADMVVRNIAGVYIKDSYDDMVPDQQGQPSEGPRLYLWGCRNLSGPVGPLFVIDGTYGSQRDFNSISPSSVESIVVIKDGTAAIYGNRAYGGVIIVTTKLDLK